MISLDTYNLDKWFEFKFMNTILPYFFNKFIFPISIQLLGFL